MQKITSHVQYSLNKDNLHKQGINTLKEFEDYLRSKGWRETMNHYIKYKDGKI